MIRDDARFIGVLDFYKRCEYLKGLYDTMSTEDKQIYKFYVYSHRRIKEYTCDTIWELLNAVDLITYAEAKEQLANDRYRYKM